MATISKQNRSAILAKNVSTISALLLLLLLLNTVFTQGTALIKGNVPFAVGFKTLLLSDNSRKFRFKDQVHAVSRPIRLFVWYPGTKANTTRPLRFEDYVYASNLKKDSDQLTSLEKENLRNKVTETLGYFEVTREQIAHLLAAEVNATSNVPAKNGKFPLLVFGNAGEGFYFFSMAESLASNGYVVVSLPSIGATEGESCGFDLLCLKLQQEDIEFAINKTSDLPNVDASRIGLLAWSFSGLAIAQIQTKNSNVKAVVSLDSATGYKYGKDILDQSNEFDPSKTNVPFLHVHGLGGSSRVPKDFSYFNAVRSKNKSLVTFKNLQHSDFVSLYGDGMRFAKKTNGATVTEDLCWVDRITLEFLNAHLKDDLKSSKFLDDLSQCKGKPSVVGFTLLNPPLHGPRKSFFEIICGLGRSGF